MDKVGIALFSFFAGTFVGAVVALFYAPMAGVELRAELREKAEEQWSMAMEQWENAMAQMQQATAEMQETTEEMQAQLEEQKESA